MGTWKSRGLRGSTLEDMINRSNEIYREKNLALIQKIPTPITPITIDKESRHITLAYFDQKSTVDYIGAVQGIPVCFDAKECAAKTFPLQNVHLHQMMFMSSREALLFLFFILRLRTRFITFPFGECTSSGNEWRMGEEKALLMKRSIRNFGFCPAVIFWYTTWRRFSGIWI